ncbi:MAG: hypothetical protein K2P90_03370 [Holosporales bacterium]|nr:hypothetical protein [Holosporales bacterium]
MFKNPFNIKHFSQTSSELFWSKTPSDLSKNLAQRVAHSYKKQIQNSALRDSMWVSIFGLNQSLHQLLIEGDIPLIHTHLKDPSRLDLFYGFENCAKTLLKSGFSRNVNAQNDHARALVKKIKQLGIF